MQLLHLPKGLNNIKSMQRFLVFYLTLKSVSLDDMTLNNYSSFTNAFEKGDNFDVSGNALFIEFKLFREVSRDNLPYRHFELFDTS